MDGFTAAQVAEARSLIAEARRKIEVEQLLIAQAKVAVAQARLLLQRGRHFDSVGDDYGNLSPAAPLPPPALGRGGYPIRRERQQRWSFIAADGYRARQPV
jgi:hypothetical protein